MTSLPSSCDVCGGTLLSNNKIGVCRRTIECARERDRRRTLAGKQRKYYAANKEKFAQRHADYYRANKNELAQKFADWDNANRDKRIIRQDRRRSRLASVPSEEISLDVLWIVQDGLCSLCGESMERDRVTLDHWVPVSKGGGTLYTNVWLAHKGCNSAKRDRMPTSIPAFVGRI